MSTMASGFQFDREIEVAWLAHDLGRSIAGLGYPVGMGVAPEETRLRIAAETLVDRYARMIELSAAYTEPVAFRWKWLRDSQWTHGAAHPGFAPDAAVTVEPLYSRVSGTAPVPVTEAELATEIDSVTFLSDVISVDPTVMAQSLLSKFKVTR